MLEWSGYTSANQALVLVCLDWKSPFQMLGCQFFFHPLAQINVCTHQRKVYRTVQMAPTLCSVWNLVSVSIHQKVFSWHLAERSWAKTKRWMLHHPDFAKKIYFTSHLSTSPHTVSTFSPLRCLPIVNTFSIFLGNFNIWLCCFFFLILVHVSVTM